MARRVTRREKKRRAEAIEISPDVSQGTNSEEKGKERERGRYETLTDPKKRNYERRDRQE